MSCRTRNVLTKHGIINQDLEVKMKRDLGEEKETLTIPKRDMHLLEMEENKLKWGFESENDQILS